MSDNHLPEGRILLHVSESNEYIQAAKFVAIHKSLDRKHPTGAVIVKNGKIIGRGANGSGFHKKLFCVRKLFRVKSGTGYFVCPGCSPKNHAEQSAIKDALKNEKDPTGADIYLWGHTYCCRWCWAAMIEAEIENVYLPEV